MQLVVHGLLQQEQEQRGGGGVEQVDRRAGGVYRKHASGGKIGEHGEHRAAVHDGAVYQKHKQRAGQGNGDAVFGEFFAVFENACDIMNVYESVI